MSAPSAIAPETQFVLLAVRHEAAYWTPATIAVELHRQKLLEAPSQDDLKAFTDAILKRLVGKAAERFWANDAITPARAASIRAAAKALHGLTAEAFVEAVADAPA